MKRLFFPLLAALALTILITGCGKASSAPEAPAPTPEVVYVIVTPEPTPEVVYVTVTPEPTPEVVYVPVTPEPTPEVVYVTVTPEPAPVEPGFPGGLDDDGRGPEEAAPYPLRDISMSPDQQYEANIFLSNFAEQFFGDYSEFEESAATKAVHFAHIWSKLNDHDSIRYKQQNGSSYEVLTLEQIRAVIDRYFYLPVSDSALEKGLLYPEHSFYQNGEFWFEAADGESYNRFAVADRLTLLSDETYEISFTVYEVDLMEYFDQGVSSDYYHLTSQEAAGAGFTRIASGTALALPHSYRDRATYQLLEYHTW